MRILRKLLFIAPALGLLGAFLLGSPVAGAQEREPVDLELSMANRYPGATLDGTFVVSVTNNSPVTVRNIRVRLELDDLTEGRTIFLREHNPGDVSLYLNDGIVNYDSLEWVIPELRSGLGATTRLSTDNARNADTTQALLLRLQGSIVESTPREDPRRLGDNYARTYVRYFNDPNINIYMSILVPSVRYGVDADPGTDTFTVKVTNPNREIHPYSVHTPLQYQLRVRVTSSQGLRYTASPSAGTSFNQSTGIWDIGTLPRGTSPGGNPLLDIQVTERDARAGPAEDQCLTAEIEHIIPDLDEPYLPVTACMAHKALLLATDSDLFTVYDCVSESNYPCGGQPSVELVAVKSAYRFGRGRTTIGPYAVGDVHRARFRSDDFGGRINPNRMVLQPEEVVLQVPYLRRHQVRGGQQGDERWRSPLTFMGPPGTPAEGWKPLTFEVSDVSPKQRPGSMQFMIARTGRTTDLVLLDPDSSSSFTSNNGLSASYYSAYQQFETLGTYRVKYTFGGTKSGAAYADSATYTFHVGPVAELEVGDEPAHSMAEPGQRAYTIVARNQGPDTAPAVRVRLTGVPRDAEAIPGRGSYAQGTCGEDGLCQGIWDIGEMRDAASLSAEGRTEEEVLTIIPPAGGGPITATIENTRDYSVTIAGTTHTASYYDYLDHNNEAEIALRGASSIGLQGRPERPTVTRVPAVAGLPSFALVQWQPMEYVNGFRVTHYQVQRSSSPWETVAGDVGGTMYLDMQDGSASAAYRVRAVNEGGGHGPWSLASLPGSAAPGEPRNLRATADGPDEIRLTWSRPSGLRGELSHYELESAWQDPDLPGQLDWALLAEVKPEDGTVFVDAGLPPDSTWHYRVRAVVWDGREFVKGPWSRSASATIGMAGPGEPWDLQATPEGQNSIRLTWRAPDDGSGLSYRIDHSTDLESWNTLRGSHTGACTVNGERLPCYTHGGLLPGTEHHYRVAAVRGGAFSPWAGIGPVYTGGEETTAPDVPRNLRLTGVGRGSATLAWDPPASDGGTRITGYEYQVFGPCSASEPESFCLVVQPTRTGGTSRTISGLNVRGVYEFQVRALNAVGAGEWTYPGVNTLINPHSSGRVVLSPTSLTVTEGSTATYRVKLSTAPTYPVMVLLHWEGDEDLFTGDADGNGYLPAQQFQVLTPSNYRAPEGETWYAWNVGIPITVAALEDADTENGTGLITHDLWTLSCAELNYVPSVCQGDNPADPEDPVYHGMYGTTLKVTERDTGSNGPVGNIGGQHGSPGAGAPPTAVTLALDSARVSESAGEATVTATLDGPAPEGGIGGFLLASDDGTASEDIDFTMPLGIFIPGGQRSATVAIFITGDDLDEADETVMLSALFDIGTALLQDDITLTIADDDTAGVTVSAASGLAVDEDGTASYTVVLDSQPTADVTVIPFNEDETKVLVTPGSNTFTPSDWHTPLTFTVSGVADDDRNDESVLIRLGVTSADEKYAAVQVNSVLVAVSDTTPEQQQGPPNQPPTVASAIADATIVSENGTLEVSLNGVFSDADNDALTITAVSDDEAVATVSVAADYSSLTVTAQARDTATITVTANDGNGGTVEDSFTVTVKAAPVVASAIGDVAGLEVLAAREISLSGVFSDADGDSLTLSAASSDEDVVTAALFDDALTLYAFEEGTATITVTAQDADGNTVSDSFDVTVVGPPTPVANLSCVAETGRVAFLWDAPEWSGGEVYAYDYDLTLPGGRSESGRLIGGTVLLRPGEYQAGGEASISVKAVYELADGSNVSSAEATLNCTVE